MLKIRTFSISIPSEMFPSTLGEKWYTVPSGVKSNQILHSVQGKEFPKLTFKDHRTFPYFHSPEITMTIKGTFPCGILFKLFPFPTVHLDKCPWWLFRLSVYVQNLTCQVLHIYDSTAWWPIWNLILLNDPNKKQTTRIHPRKGGAV